MIDAAQREGRQAPTKAGRYLPPVLSGDGKQAATFRGEPKPVVKDANSSEVIATLPFRISDLFRPSALDSAGERIAIYPGDGVRVWDVARRQRDSPRCHARTSSSMPMPSRRRGGTWARSRRATVSIYGSDDGSVVVELSRSSERINEMEFSRDDAFILTAGNDAGPRVGAQDRPPVASFEATGRPCTAPPSARARAPS